MLASQLLLRFAGCISYFSRCSRIWITALFERPVLAFAHVLNLLGNVHQISLGELARTQELQHSPQPLREVRVVQIGRLHTLHYAFPLDTPPHFWYCDSK